PSGRRVEPACVDVAPADRQGKNTTVHPASEIRPFLAVPLGDIAHRQCASIRLICLRKKSSHIEICSVHGDGEGPTCASTQPAPERPPVCAVPPRDIARGVASGKTEDSGCI